MPRTTAEPMLTSPPVPSDVVSPRAGTSRKDSRGAAFLKGLEPRRAYQWIILAILLVISMSFVADYVLRQETLRNQRIEVSLETRMIAASLQREMEARLAALKDFGIAAENTGHPNHSHFDSMAKAFSVGDIVAVSLWDSDGTIFRYGRSRELAALLNEIPNHSAADRSGALASSGPAGNAFLIWQKIDGAGGTGEPVTVAAVVAADPLLTEVGFHDGLKIALSAGGNEISVPGGAVPPEDEAVASPVNLLGSQWFVRATPLDGWSSSGAKTWAIWGQGLIAILLVLGLMFWESVHYERLRRKNLALLDREFELEQLSRRLNLALDASDVGIWEYLVDTDELIWDKRMYELFATPLEEKRLTLDCCQRRVHPDDRERVDQVFSDAVSRLGRLNIDFRLLLPDGTIRYVRAIGSVHSDRDGATKVVGINLDITEEVLRSAELESKRDEAEHASLAKSQFLATMSHEIRTPMNGVIGMLDLLLRSDLDETQRERASVAAASAGQLLTLLNDVLDFSKLDANRIELHKAELDVRRLAEDVAALASATIGDRKLRIVVNVGPNVPETIPCDPVRLRQILNNLVGNAVKFTDVGTVEIEISHVTTPRPEVIFSVRDTGIGIPEAEKAHLFERYSQVDSSMTRTRGGTGLGLAICKQLVELMGGEITVRSVFGLGSTFEFNMPIDRPLEPAKRRISVPQPVPASSDPIRILVAEDNPTNQQVLSAYLELDGHEIAVVPDGEAALKRLEYEEFDLVFMDIQMPKLDGLSAARRLRETSGRNSTIPIVALTANALPGDREAYMQAGMTEYLSKPVSLEDLSTVIARLTSYRAKASWTAAARDHQSVT